MSIRLPLHLLRDGAVVHRDNIPGGYIALKDRNVLIHDMISTIDIADSFMRRLGRGPLPKFDTAKVIIAGGEDIVLPGSAFENLFAMREMQRQGVATEHVLSLTQDHRKALEELDRSAYTAEQKAEWEAAIWVTHVLANALTYDVKEEKKLRSGE